MRSHAESLSYSTYNDPTATEVIRRTTPSKNRKIRHTEVLPVNLPQQDPQTKPVTLFSIEKDNGLNVKPTDIAKLDELAAELRLLRLKRIIDKDQYREGIKRIYKIRRDIKKRNK